MQVESLAETVNKVDLGVLTSFNRQPQADTPLSPDQLLAGCSA
jgi:hypothetical protein